jgi:gas vesicle protein
MCIYHELYHKISEFAIEMRENYYMELTNQQKHDTMEILSAILRKRGFNMKLAMAVFGVAALVGAGYVIGKKIQESRQREDDLFNDDFENFDGLEGLMDEDGVESDVYAKERRKYGDKIKKASLFAVGAIKTGADKFGETIQDIKSQDMVKKGEQTVDAVKETSGNIKNDIKREVEDLKCMVASINDDEVEQAAKADDLFGNTSMAADAGSDADSADDAVS